MLVLAVDTQDQRNPEQKSILAQTVTLAATPEEATRLALASSIGELRLLPKAHGDTKRMANVVDAASSDLDKPLRPSDGAERRRDRPPAPRRRERPRCPRCPRRSSPPHRTPPAPAASRSPARST